MRYGDDGGEPDDDETATDDGSESADDDDEIPGFGPVAGAAGVTGAAYLYSKYGADDDEPADD